MSLYSRGVLPSPLGNPPPGFIYALTFVTHTGMDSIEVASAPGELQMKDGEPSASELSENPEEALPAATLPEDPVSESKTFWNGRLNSKGLLTDSWGSMQSVAFEPTFVFHVVPSGRRFFKKAASLTNSRTWNTQLQARIKTVLPTPTNDAKKTEVWWRRVAALSFIFFACRNNKDKEIPRSTSKAAWFTEEISSKVQAVCLDRYKSVPADLSEAAHHIFNSLVPLFDPQKALLESFVYHPDFVLLKPRPGLPSFPSPCPRTERATLAVTCNNNRVFLYNPHPFAIEKGSAVALSALAVSSPFNACTKWSPQQESLASLALSEVQQDDLNFQFNLLFFLSKNVYLKEGFTLPAKKQVDAQTRSALGKFFWSRVGLTFLRTLVHEELEEKDELKDDFAVEIYLWVSFYDFIALETLRQGSAASLQSQGANASRAVCDTFIELLSLLFPQGEGVLPFLLHKGVMSRWVAVVELLLDEKNPSFYAYNKFLNGRRKLLHVRGGGQV